MTRDDTATLVNLLVSTWPTGVRGHVWTDTLSELDHTPALATYRALRDRSDRAPSVAQFLADYRERVDTTHRPARRQPRTDCAHCGGDGVVDCLDERRHAAHCIAPDDCNCHAVVPCTCVEPARPLRVERPEQLEVF